MITIALLYKKTKCIRNKGIKIVRQNVAGFLDVRSAKTYLHRHPPTHATKLPLHVPELGASDGDLSVIIIALHNRAPTVAIVFHRSSEVDEEDFSTLRDEMVIVFDIAMEYAGFVHLAHGDHNQSTAAHQSVSAPDPPGTPIQTHLNSSLSISGTSSPLQRSRTKHPSSLSLAIPVKKP